MDSNLDVLSMNYWNKKERVEQKLHRVIGMMNIMKEAHRLTREIKEETNADIEVEKFINTIEYDYTNFHLIMHSYICLPFLLRYRRWYSLEVC